MSELDGLRPVHCVMRAAHRTNDLCSRLLATRWAEDVDGQRTVVEPDDLGEIEKLRWLQPGEERTAQRTCEEWTTGMGTATGRTERRTLCVC